jgi:hypothetical protein
MRNTVSLIGLVLAIVPAAFAQTPQVGPNQRYLLLSTQRTATMQTELGEAAAQGFRVVAGSPTTGSEMLLFLERLTQPPETYAYRLLATTRVSTMQKELNQAATEGFRLLPQLTMLKGQVGSGFGVRPTGRDLEIVVVVERALKASKRYDYRLLATEKSETLQKEVTDAVAAGFVLVGLLSRDEHMVVMERELPQ